MFDRSLDKSEIYFAVLQILRIMSEWIYESVTALEKQKEEWAQVRQVWRGAPEYLSETNQEIDRGIINSNWDVLLSHHAKLEKVLRDRIDRKAKEVESLRDGVISKPI